ncbi:GtrA family protein [Solitalea canadensis]|uniref:Putative membrane protein n=1 Tax=Solitalea canadensis (strain ATCC 29591 / DSM 3403 / JCM 21819 / LMG 8368 / NBRC 15130 / NCIMB 12057 / USAM 9D) TaxID=929556 RepID=H8KQP4_SOLCM|nr:GtrA family protein [Solitalea canadensis]AFD06782.1 putative membrane protein [Solitalea canadensis DSM 3403]
MADNQRRKKIIDLSKNIFENKAFRFLISGGTSTAVDIGVYFVFFNFVIQKQPVYFLNSQVSAHIASLCVSFTAGFITNFFISKYFVFNSSNLRTRVQLFRYVIVAAINFSANYFLLKFFVEFMHWFPTLSRAVAAMIVAVLSFFLGKYFAFRVKTA